MVVGYDGLIVRFIKPPNILPFSITLAVMFPCRFSNFCFFASTRLVAFYSDFFAPSRGERGVFVSAF